jgi:multiple sugar transport system substrate-binding protein
MKRFLAIAMASVLALSLAACGSPSPSPTAAPSPAAEPTAEPEAQAVSETVPDPLTVSPAKDYGGITIKISSPWGWDLTPGVSSDQDLFIQRIADVEKKYNVKIEMFKGPDEYWDTMVTTIMSGEPLADIMYAHTWYFVEWFLAGAVKDLTGLGLNFGDPAINPVTVEEATYFGRVGGFGADRLDPNAVILFNKRMFEENNLTSPYELIEQGKWDFATFKEYAKALTKDTNSDGTMDQWGITAFDPFTTGINLVFSNGGGGIDFAQRPPQFTLTEPKALEAINLFNEMVNTDQSLLMVDPTDWTTGPNIFINGQAAMLDVEWWVLEWIGVQDMSDEYGIVPFPMGPQATKFVDGVQPGIYFMPVTTSDEKAEACFAVYCDIFRTLHPELTEEERLEAKYMAGCRDEEGLAYMIKDVQGYQVPTNLGKSGLQSDINAIFESIANKEGTPASILDAHKDELQAKLNDKFGQ